MSHMAFSYHIDITGGDKATTRSRSFERVPVPPLCLSRCVILQTRNVATGGFGKVIVRLLPATVCSQADDPASWSCEHSLLLTPG